MLRYRLDAIEAALQVQDVAVAQRQMDALEAFTAAEPLPLTTIIVKRARLLAKPLGVSYSPSEVAVSLRALIASLGEVGWTRAMPAVEAALAAVEGRLFRRAQIAQYGGV